MTAAGAFPSQGAAVDNALVSEIVTDPEIPAAARRELERARPDALVGFGDQLPGQAEPAVAGADRLARPAHTGARVTMAASLAAAAALIAGGVATSHPRLVVLAVLLFLPVAVLSALTAYGDREPAREAEAGRPGLPAGPAVTYHRRYVVPEEDLHDVALARWRRARTAAQTIQTSEAVGRGLIDTVEITAVLPYHLWDIAERLALMAAPERRLPAILRGVNTDDPGVQAVLGPQRRVHDLAVADVEGRIGRLEEFAALAGKADAARKRRRAIEELARLNPDYEELLVRLGEPGSTLSVAGSSADDLRAVAAEADAAVRRANEAGRALVIPAGSEEQRS